MSDVVEVEPKESHAENIHATLPGQKLKEARENKNLKQDDIAKQLRIDSRFVKALEEERFNELPQPVYTSGYVRAYSKLVGLVPDEIVTEYSSHQKASVKEKPKVTDKEEIPTHYRHVQSALPKTFSVGHSQSEEKRKFNIGVSVVAVIVVFAIVWQVSDKPSDTTVSLEAGDASTVSDTGAAADLPKEPATVTRAVESSEQSQVKLELPPAGSQQQQAGVADKGQTFVGSEEQVAAGLAKNAEKITELSLHYTEDSWVDIRDATGKAIIRKLGIAGKSHTVSGIAPFEVLLGYSPGVSIEHDGEPYDLSAYSEKRVARFVLNSDGGVEKSRSILSGTDLIRSKIERSEPFAFED